MQFVQDVARFSWADHRTARDVPEPVLLPEEDPRPTPRVISG
jgi:hypothetical protein